MATEHGDEILLLIEPKSDLYDAYEPFAAEKVPLPVGVRQRGNSKVTRDTVLKLLGTVTANPSGASILNNASFSDARLRYTQRDGITVEIEGCKEVAEIPFLDFYSGAVRAFDEKGTELPVKKYSKLIGRKYAAKAPLIKKLLEEVEGDQCGAVQASVAAAYTLRATLLAPYLTRYWSAICCRNFWKDVSEEYLSSCLRCPLSRSCSVVAAGGSL